jgi:hypothetical protein
MDEGGAAMVPETLASDGRPIPQLPPHLRPPHVLTLDEALAVRDPILLLLYKFFSRPCGDLHRASLACMCSTQTLDASVR